MYGFFILQVFEKLWFMCRIVPLSQCMYIQYWDIKIHFKGIKIDSPCPLKLGRTPMLIMIGTEGIFGFNLHFGQLKPTFFEIGFRTDPHIIPVNLQSSQASVQVS